MGTRIEVTEGLGVSLCCCNRVGRRSMPFREFNREQGWLLPPDLGELVDANHPARFVAAFVDALDEEAWEELGIDLRGEPLGASSYHPRALLSVWIYGFMTGVRSSRKLEAACREQVAFMWLTGRQRPDHNTLWRFYRTHRERMRILLNRTVRTAVKAGLVDLALQAVDGTRIAGNASSGRTYDEQGLRRLLERTQAAIADLEAKNSTGGEPASVELPSEIASAEALRDRVTDALGRVMEEEGPNHANLTDPDAGLLKSREGGFITGYNAQSMVAPISSDDASGMIITAANVTSSSDDHPQLVPMIEASIQNTGAGHAVTVADAGYHSGTNLADCASSGHRVLMPDTHDRRRRSPYHKDHFTYDPGSDTYLCPNQQPLTFKDTFTHANGYRLRRYRADGGLCRACPAFGDCTTSNNGRSIRVSEYEPELRRHRELLSTESARSMYKRRQELVEPVFGLLKECHGAKRFLLRGRQNVLSEWSLLAAAFNLKSLHTVWSSTSLSNPPHSRSPRLHLRCDRRATEATRTHRVPRRTARPYIATRRIHPVYRSSHARWLTLYTPHETI